jgi:hypothetical protein
MARNATVVATSNKVFGGNAVPAGIYLISGSRIVEATMNLNGEERKYDALELMFKTLAGAEVNGTLSLNGCWRPRRGEDGRPYQASGSFFTELLNNCTGKSFTEVRDHINATLVGRKVAVNYTDYPSLSGGYGRVPVVEYAQ